MSTRAPTPPPLPPPSAGRVLVDNAEELLAVALLCVISATMALQVCLRKVAGVVRAVTGALHIEFDAQRDLPNYRVGKLSIERARAELDCASRLPLRLGIEACWQWTFAAGRKS